MSQENEQVKNETVAAKEAVTDKPAKETKPRRIHWRSGFGILLGGIIAESVIVTVYADDDTLKVYSTLMFVIPIIGGLFILWWLFRSGFSWRIRCAGILIAVLSFVSFNLRYRIDGFSGAMIPNISLRSDPTPEERIAVYFKSAVNKASAAPDETLTDDSDEPPAAERQTLEITDDDWPRFRGAQGDSIVRGVTIRTDWKENPPQPLWRHPVGPAWSSFTIADNLLFTQEQRGLEEVVVCYDALTGREIWLHENNERHSTLMGGTGPRATPTLYESRLYVMGATGILNCLDPLTGKVHWATNILEDAGADGKAAQNVQWGMAASPLVFDDVVVVNPGGDQGKSVIVYDRLTGQQKWASGKQPASYAGPILETIQGKRQLLIFDAIGTAGYDPQNGKELWRFAWSNSPKINVAQPIVRDESLVLISSGYGTGSALLEIENVSGDNWTVKPRWRKPGQFKLKFNDAVYKDGYLYGLDEGILACFEFKTGKKLWKRGRFGHGQLLLIDDADLLLILAEDGNIVLVPATPNGFRETARFQAIEGKTWNHPVLNRGRLYVRNFQEAACYDLSRR
ncbi:MAG: PQQ-binding-like beta-propeller repeat protein [Planctomycetaceae bacterium]|nr:PQQ-binding-like beta-propeller repeat protein [Planctomycetaceae bacterium]